MKCNFKHKTSITTFPDSKGMCCDTFGREVYPHHIGNPVMKIIFKCKLSNWECDGENCILMNILKKKIIDNY